MKYGIREICDVVLKAKSTIKVGTETFHKGQPVIYFDSLKTSTMEGAATTVYAQGGRGNSRLVAWEGERTVTFTMEDALISELGLSVLTGAGVINAGNGTAIKVHSTGKAQVKNGTATLAIDEALCTDEEATIWAIELDEYDNTLAVTEVTNGTLSHAVTNAAAKAVMFDFYVERQGSAKQIEITADKFAGNYYLEASTLFRGQDGVDRPAEFIIPNCKIQSNFTFTMASSGDPSTFTFTMDAFPDYTKFDPTKKVLSVIQIIEEEAPLGDQDGVEASAVFVGGDDSIAVGEQALYVSAVAPHGAASAVKWSVTKGTGDATITSGGLLTGTKVGTVTVKATTVVGNTTGTKEVTIVAGE